MKQDRSKELRYSSLAPLLRFGLRSDRLRRVCVSLLLRLEGGDFYSGSVRSLLKDEYGVEVGAFSYGPCMVPGAFPRGVKVGRYVSVGPGVRVFVRDHPLDHVSLHPFFYNRELGFVEQDRISSGALEIGHDAWIGANVLITKSCTKIGIGAAVGAGAVVTHDVPDFAVVGGNPARLIRMRFSSELCDALKASRWWELSPAECLTHTETFLRPLTRSDRDVLDLIRMSVTSREQHR